jgi:B9 domain-containing protein 2
MAEVHIIGEIIQAQDFVDRSLFAKWNMNAGSCWRVLEGFTEGQTQLSLKYLEDSALETTDAAQPQVTLHSWSHPIDVHYLTKGLQGWPQMEFQVWGVDWLGKCNISAYGFINVPLQPGYHQLECHTWRPVGDFRRRIIDYITGYRMHLVNPSDIISNSLNRHVIQSESMGTLKINLTVVLKDFHEYGVDLD